MIHPLNHWSHTQWCLLVFSEGYHSQNFSQIICRVGFLFNFFYLVNYYRKCFSDLNSQNVSFGDVDCFILFALQQDTMWMSVSIISVSVLGKISLSKGGFCILTACAQISQSRVMLHNAGFPENPWERKLMRFDLIQKIRELCGLE